MWQHIADHISNAVGQKFTVDDYRSVGGGSINQAYCLIGQTQKYFVKTNAAIKLSMFEAEAVGLNEMADTNTIKVPRALCWGIDEQKSYIVLEWISLGRGNGNWAQLGQDLARLHKTVSHQGYGWHQPNTIGDTPQMNHWCESWSDFYCEHRLGYQFQLANRKGASFRGQEEVIQVAAQILDSHPTEPSLVHGDLWSGNASFSEAGEPMIFDPATYYGDREVDIAMTELFGGFPSDFYQGYESEFPIPKGYSQRKVLYNLYHILNHYNLFGGGYQSQAQQMINQLLK